MTPPDAPPIVEALARAELRGQGLTLDAYDVRALVAHLGELAEAADPPPFEPL